MPELVAALESGHPATQHAAAWGVLHTATHGASIADQLAAGGVLPPLLALHCGGEGEARACAKGALKEVARHCTDAAPLLALVRADAPPDLLSHVLQQTLRIMQGSVASRREFVTTGALAALQQLEPRLDGKGQAAVAAINALFPADVVSYYRHGVQRQAR